jgi:hypothetical protein
MDTEEMPQDVEAVGEVDGAHPVQSLTPEAPDSLVDQIRGELEELSEIQEVFIPVVGYSQSRLQVKYRMPESGKEIDLIGQKVSRETKDRYNRNLLIAMDMMIHLCAGLYVQPDGAEEPVELDPQELGEPVYFDERLAEIIGLNGGSGSARIVLRKLFGNHDLAILNHSEKLSRWLANNKADLERELWEMGE